MNKIFARTRLARPADQKRYANAKKSYVKADGSCAELGGTASEVVNRVRSGRQGNLAQDLEGRPDEHQGVRVGREGVQTAQVLIGTGEVRSRHPESETCTAARTG